MRSRSCSPVPPVALAAILGLSVAEVVILSPGDAAAQSPGGRPWLGVSMDTDTRAPGVRVGHVVRGSPAEKAGVHEGDRLVRVAGAAVNQGSDVVHAVSGRAVGDIVEIVFARGGVEHAARVPLAAFPSQDDMMRMDLVGAAAPAWKDVQVVRGAFPSSLDALRGRVVLLDFWATWCAPCRVVIPKLDALESRYGAQGLSVLGVSTEGSQEVASFAQNMAIRYAMGVDTHAQTTRSYGVVSLPTLVVIDKRGVVRDVAVGYDPGEDARLDAMVRSLLAEPGAAQPPPP
jgi:thiol-disulfide isomerase/thioredoxin